MTPELQALARRAVACKGWRWMPGMLTDVGERVTDPTICYLGTLPDLSDPLTVQALLLLVREAWGRPMLVAYYAPLSMGQGWYVADRFCGDRDYPVVEAPSGSEAEALFTALEAAP